MSEIDAKVININLLLVKYKKNAIIGRKSGRQTTEMRLSSIIQ